jgi:uncharacterized Fe-S center protein
MTRMFVPEREIGIKINVSEMGYDRYLPPMFLSLIYKHLRELATVPVVTDSGSLFNGSRSTGYRWADTVLMKGYPIADLLDNQVFLAGGYTNEEGNFTPCAGDHLGGVEVGSVPLDCQHLLVLSHVTAHPLMGIAGAIYNLGWGLLTSTGKLRIHEYLDMEYDEARCDHCQVCVPFCPTGAISTSQDPSRIQFDARICNSCLGCVISCPHAAFRVQPDGIPTYQEGMVEAAHTVRSVVEGHAFFVNFLMAVTPQTDEYPYADVPFIPDLGILASEDPVALDWATYQMITRSPGTAGSVSEELNVLERGQDKIKAITGQTLDRMITYAEKLGLGSREAELFSSG